MQKKWIITLAMPAIVDDVLRQPIEGSLTVSEFEATRLHLAGKLVGDPEPADEPDDGDGDADDADGLEAMTVADLNILVTKEGVALNDATKKADIIAAIRKHRADNAA